MQESPLEAGLDLPALSRFYSDLISWEWRLRPQAPLQVQVLDSEAFEPLLDLKWSLFLSEPAAA